MGTDPTNLPLDEQLVVNRAGAVAVEAVVVRVIQVLQREFFAAAHIGTIQKRAMIAGLRTVHANVIGRLGRSALK
jgi:hypothetical protein